MSTPAERRALINAVRITADARRALARALFESKVAVYTGTLAELADRYARAATVALSPELRAGLRSEADAAAASVARTFNAAVESFAQAHAELEVGELAARLEEWAIDRGEKIGPLVAVTEAYSPHADATLKFFRDAGLSDQVRFDFGGHGDAPPKCVLCAAIIERNPHTLEAVVNIGTPHPRCRQDWHPLLSPSDVPDELQLGLGRPVGIVDQPTLLQRFDNDLHDATSAVRTGTI